MANEVLVKSGTQLLFADHATDFGSAPATAANSLIVGTPTDVDLDLTGVANDGARESDKFDFGATRAPWYRLEACIEWEAAPTDAQANRMEFYLGPSPNATAGSGNPGGLTGVDAAYTVTLGKLNQLQYLGAMSVRNNVVNIGVADMFFRPAARYGILVVVNRSGGALRSTAVAMDETHIVITPFIDEIQ